MTAQIGDSYKYNGKLYEIVAHSAPKQKVFDPADYGLNPSSIETCCWDGYWCEFEVTDALYLQKLTVHCDDCNYPDICGRNTGIPYEVMQILASSPDFDNTGYVTYEEMNLKIPYSGRILVGDDVIRKYCFHMGYQRAYAYKKLIEFELEDGILKNIQDLSKKAEDFRKKMNGKDVEEFEHRGGIPDFIARSFSQNYGVKTWW